MAISFEEIIQKVERGEYATIEKMRADLEVHYWSVIEPQVIERHKINLHAGYQTNLEKLRVAMWNDDDNQARYLMGVLNGVEMTLCELEGREYQHKNFTNTKKEPLH